MICVNLLSVCIILFLASLGLRFIVFSFSLSVSHCFFSVTLFSFPMSVYISFVCEIIWCGAAFCPCYIMFSFFFSLLNCAALCLCYIMLNCFVCVTLFSNSLSVFTLCSVSLCLCHIYISLCYIFNFSFSVKSILFSCFLSVFDYV